MNKRKSLIIFLPMGEIIDRFSYKFDNHLLFVVLACCNNNVPNSVKQIYNIIVKDITTLTLSFFQC